MFVFIEAETFERQRRPTELQKSFGLILRSSKKLIPPTKYYPGMIYEQELRTIRDQVSACGW